MISKILSNKHIQEILTSAKHGYLYGAKLRFAHSLALAVVFAKISSTKDVKPLLKRIFSSAQKHGISLTVFAGTYKAILAVLDHNRAGGNTKLDHFIAGFTSGYMVFGNQLDFFKSSISYQMSVYVFARVVLALARIAGDFVSVKLTQAKYGLPSGQTAAEIDELRKTFYFKETSNALANKTWNLTAALSWGLVMMLWKYHKKSLNSSLSHSMDYIYLG